VTAERIVVAWFRFARNGSIGRFLHFARQVAPWGYRVDFLSLTGDTGTDWPDFPGRVLTPADVEDRSWDAVMVPGAGHGRDPIERLAELRHERYGRRIQHVLDDPSGIDRAARVNALLDPHLVVFNSGRWTPEDYRPLSASAFHTVAGAVDTSLFTPLPLKTVPCDPPGWRIGAFAGNNPGPVLDALDELPRNHVLHTFGIIPGEHRERVDALLEAERLVDHGSLFGDRLARFFADLDVMVTTETRGGWCDPAAEAMASGVPCVVSPAGTVDFAIPGETAEVLEDLSGSTIARTVRSLTSDPPALRALARAGAAHLRRFDWNTYSQCLLDVIAAPLHEDYYRIPELGLYGKWDPRSRLTGLEGLLGESPGATVLDLGAAEGIIGREFANHGAELVHGFELSADRASMADEVLRDSLVPEHVVRQADLADWDAFETANGDVLRDSYDIVLFLGLYHHLPENGRRRSLQRALARSRRWFALRTPAEVSASDELVAACQAEGFHLVSEANGREHADPGWLGVFRRGHSLAAVRPSRITGSAEDDAR